MSAEQDVAKLHEDFCRIARRDEKLRYHSREWFELLRLPEYDGNAALLGADVEKLVRYLLSMIAREKRNPGALKLRNFLQPDQFLADLAEAKPLRPIPPPKPDRAQTHQVSGADKVTVLAPVEPERTVLPLGKGQLREAVEAMRRAGRETKTGGQS